MTHSFQNIHFADHDLPKDIDSSNLVVRNLSDSKRAASFRILRHKITQHEHVQSLLVTSPTQGCGKSFVALNLALALAEQAKGPTLLMEANAPTKALRPSSGLNHPIAFWNSAKKTKTQTPLNGTLWI